MPQKLIERKLRGRVPVLLLKRDAVDLRTSAIAVACYRTEFWFGQVFETIFYDRRERDGRPYDSVGAYRLWRGVVCS